MVNLGFVKIDFSNFIGILIGLVIFVVQLILLFKGKYIIIKLLPVILLVTAGIVCFIGLLLSTGWDAIGWLLLVVFAIIFLCVCAGAWAIYGIVKLIKLIVKSKKAE